MEDEGQSGAADAVAGGAADRAAAAGQAGGGQSPEDMTASSTSTAAGAAGTSREAGSGSASAADVPGLEGQQEQAVASPARGPEESGAADGGEAVQDDDELDELEEQVPDDEPDGGQRPEELIRLQRVLAAAGVASRRASEELIAQGRVSVDGQVVREQGRRVDPRRSVVRVDGERVVTDAALTHLVLNKPRGVVSTMSDDRGRPSLGDYVADRTDRVSHVGRLDLDSEGLVLLTNDGVLAHRLLHPSHGVTKTYLAEVVGSPGRDAVRALRRGVELEDGPVVVDAFRVVDASGGSRALVEVVLHEGRKHIVRRLLAEVGHPVTRLVRTAFGPLHLGTLKPGRVRHLTRHEVSALYRSVDL